MYNICVLCFLSPQAHIGAILLSKFTSYQDFHTQLYTCAAEFDYLPLSYPLKISATILLPTAVGVAGLVVWAAAKTVMMGRLARSLSLSLSLSLQL